MTCCTPDHASSHNQTPLEIVHIAYRGLVYRLLHHSPVTPPSSKWPKICRVGRQILLNLIQSPDLVVHRIQICAVWWLQVWGDELGRWATAKLDRPRREPCEPSGCLAGKLSVHHQFDVLRAACYWITAHHGITFTPGSTNINCVHPNSDTATWHHEWLAEGRTCTEESVSKVKVK